MNKLAVFDWNGTLIDDSHANWEAGNHCLAAFDKGPITYDQYQELATDVGKSRRYLVEKLVGGEVGFNGKNWQGLNDEERIEALTKLYEDGRKIGMNQFVKVLIESGQTLTPRKSRRGPVQVN